MVFSPLLFSNPDSGRPNAVVEGLPRCFPWRHLPPCHSSLRLTALDCHITPVPADRPSSRCPTSTLCGAVKRVALNRADSNALLARALRPLFDNREILDIDLWALQKVLLYLASNLHLRFLIDGSRREVLLVNF